MKLNESIESAEFNLKRILEEYFVNVYDEESLPSHGLDHHRRVWRNAMELLKLLDENGLLSASVLPHKLIIACYLHDIGMTNDRGIMHGCQSRELCTRFLSLHDFRESDYEDVLTAIENHDNKDYKSLSVRYDILSILSVADDLDAFGFVGIFRYSEIYLARKIKPQELGKKVLENASVRFMNFKRSFGFSENLIHRHKLRYDILIRFFREYNIYAPDYDFGNIYPSGPCGVVDIIVSMILNKRSLKETADERQQYSYDPVIITFFDGLVKEMMP